MIELGLARISRLLQQTQLPWKAIHVAGTNGKGAIASYVSALLARSDVRCGRFTSPHLIDRWDCITINEQVVQESLFLHIENEVKQRNQRLGIGATEFELLTATAFEIFNHECVEVGVVEVGLGGRLDATNILKDVLVSVISKIGLDHQSMLGHTIAEIAQEKAGIIKPGVPCVIDGTNAPEAIEAVNVRAKEIGADTLFVRPDLADTITPELRMLFNKLDLQPHQQENLCCAIAALKIALQQVRPAIDTSNLLPHVDKIQWPGRLQRIDIGPLVGKPQNVLLDGAHNVQSAEVLASYVDRKLRRPDESVTWVVGASQGKDLINLFSTIIKPGDNVVAVKFGPVDGMPWVQSTGIAELLAAVKTIPALSQAEGFEDSLLDGLNRAVNVAAGRPLVIAGSLYLVSDILRLLRSASVRS